MKNSKNNSLVTYRRFLNKCVKSIKKVLQILESVRKSPPAKNLHHAEKANQPAMEINRLDAIKHEPKT